MTYFSGAAKTVTYPATWGTVTEIDSFYNATDGGGMRRGYVANCSAATGAGTVTFSANVDFPAVRISEYSGLATSSPLVGTGTTNRQASPGTGAGAVTVSVTPSSQPALVLGTSIAMTTTNWDTAVSDTGRSRVWEYTSGTSFAAKPQDARVTSTSAKALTWTTSAGSDVYWSWSVAFVEPGGGGGGTTTTKVMSDALTLSDDALDPVRRVRRSDDTLSLSDAIVKSVVFGSGIFVKVMTDTLSASDTALDVAIRVRRLSDTVDVTEPGALRTAIIVANDAIDATDSTVQWRRLARRPEDALTLADSIIRSVAGVGIVYTKVMSDVAVLSDGSTRYVLRVRQTSDAITTNDAIVRALSRVRRAEDLVALDDGLVKVQRLRRVATDTLDVPDEIVKLLVFDQLYTVNLRFGHTDPFRFGSGSSNVFSGGS